MKNQDGLAYAQSRQATVGSFLCSGGADFFGSTYQAQQAVIETGTPDAHFTGVLWRSGHVLQLVHHHGAQAVKTALHGDGQDETIGRPAGQRPGDDGKRHGQRMPHIELIREMR